MPTRKRFGMESSMSGFEDIIGHSKIKEHLKNSIRLNKVSHAYLFVGDKGVGKKTMAKAFAQTLQCEEKGIVPCMKCKSCLQAVSDNQPDIRMLTHEKAAISVDEIRSQLVNDAGIMPYAGPYKIYIVPDAHLLNAAAQNAMLKTIEEPPSYVVVILVVDNKEALLPTILSRCVTINFMPLSDKEITKYLMEKQMIPDYAAAMAAAFSQGSVEKAVKIAMSKEYSEKKERLISILRAIDEMTIAEVVGYARDNGADKEFFDDMLWVCRCWYKDVLMLKATSDLNGVLFKDEYKYLKKQASNYSFEDVEKIIQAIDKAGLRYKANVSLETIIELLVLTMKKPM